MYAANHGERGTAGGLPAEDRRDICTTDPYSHHRRRNKTNRSSPRVAGHFDSAPNGPRITRMREKKRTAGFCSVTPLRQRITAQRSPPLSLPGRLVAINSLARKEGRAHCSCRSFMPLARTDGGATPPPRWLYVAAWRMSFSLCSLLAHHWRCHWLYRHFYICSAPSYLPTSPLPPCLWIYVFSVDLCECKVREVAGLLVLRAYLCLSVCSAASKRSGPTFFIRRSWVVFALLGSRESSVSTTERMVEASL